MNMCDQEQRLTPFLLGDLPGPEADAVRLHLAQCAACQEAVRQIEPTLAALRNALVRDAGAQLQFSPARRARLLAVRPQSPPPRVIRWLHANLSLLAAAACVTLIMSAMLMPATRSACKLARHGQEAPALTCSIVDTEASDSLSVAGPAGGQFADRDGDGMSDKQAAGRESNAFLTGNDKADGKSENAGYRRLKTRLQAEQHEYATYETTAQLSIKPRREPQGEPLSTETRILSGNTLDFGYGGGGGKDGGPGVVGGKSSNDAKESGAVLSLERKREDRTFTFHKDREGERGEIKPASPPGESYNLVDEGQKRGNVSGSARGGDLPDAAGAGTSSRDDDRAGSRDGWKENQPASAPAAATPAPAENPMPREPDKSKQYEYFKQELPPGASRPVPTKPSDAAARSSASGKAESSFETVNFLDVAAVKSPVTMRGLYAARDRPETRSLSDNRKGGKALDRQGEAEVDGDDLRVTSNEEGVLRLKGQVSEQSKKLDPLMGIMDSIVVVEPKPSSTETGKRREDLKPAAASEALPRKPAAFNPFVDASIERFSTFSIDVDTASYTLTRQAILSGRLPEPEVVRTEEIVNAFDYGDAAPDRATFRVYVEGAPSPFGADLTMLRIGVKGRRLGREEQRPAMLTFLIDTSGSMAQPDRIGLARTALKLLLENLAPIDRIQIVAYDDRARVVLDPTPATEAAAALKAFDTLQCTGSTNLEDGMRKAYELAVRAFIPGAENRVILVSDGVANLGAGDAQEILAQIDASRRQGITCSVFGVGKGTYNDQMLEQLANKGDGVYRFLDSEEEVRRAFVDDLAATLNTIATDVKIQVEWNPATVRRYRQLGYENRALTKEQFRDDTVDAGEIGSGQSVSALYELEPESTGAARRLSLGTVRVRYRRIDTRAVEEIAVPIRPEMIARNIDASRLQFRLAVGAAEFAEILRASPYAAGNRFENVARLLRPVTLALPLDTRVKELLGLVEQAEALSK